MESVYLKTFVEVASTGNLTRAAENLNVTPSAVSRRIKFVEEQYGFELLDRSGPIVVPTQAGTVVLEKARQLIEIEKELLAGLNSMQKSSKFTFCCTPAFGIAHLPDVLRGFMLVNADLDNLEFHIDMPDNLVRGLKDNLHNHAVIEHCECLDLSGFTTYSLPDDEMVFISRPELFVSGAPVTIEALFSQPLFTRREGCCSRRFLDMNLKNINRSAGEFRKIIVYDDLHVIIDAVLKGDGVAYLSKCLVADPISKGLLAEHHIDGFQDRKKRTFVVNESVKQEPVTYKFACELLKYFGLPCEHLSLPQ